MPTSRPMARRRQRCLWLAVAALVVGTLALPRPALAQTPPHVAQQFTPEELEALRRDKNQLALYHYGSRYTFDVLLSGMAGGILGATLRGGPVATITGSTLGSLLGILWFLDSYAGTMIDKHGW